MQQSLCFLYFTDIEDNFEFALLEIILPSMGLLFGYILLVFTFKELLEFLKNVKKTKDLIADKKLQIAQRCVLRTVIALLFVLQNLFLWFMITVFLELLQYGFNYSNKVAEKLEPLFKRVNLAEELEYYESLKQPVVKIKTNKYFFSLIIYFSM